MVKPNVYSQDGTNGKALWIMYIKKIKTGNTDPTIVSEINNLINHLISSLFYLVYST